MNPLLRSSGFVWLLLVLFPLFASAITITPQPIPNTNGYTNDLTPTLTMTLEGNTGETNMSFSCDGAAFTSPVPFSSPYEQFSLTDTSAACLSSDGPRTITVQVIDSLLATTTGTFLPVVILDSTGPVISGQTPTNGSSATSQPTIGFSFNDTGIGITNSSQLSLIVNGGAPIHIGSSPGELIVNMTSKNATYVPQTPLPEGITTIEVGAFDDLGNISATDSTTAWSFEVDTNAQLTAILIDANQAFTNSLDANLSIVGDSDLNACQFSLTSGSYGSDWIPFSGNMHFVLSPSGDGNKTVWGHCKDEANNLTEEQSDQIGLDTVVPGTPSLSMVSIHPTQVDLRWTAVTDSGISGLKEYEVFKNGSSVANHLSTSTLDYNVTGLTSGTAYTFKLVARDNAGNESFAQQIVTTPGVDTNQTVDTVPPTVSWLGPANNAIISGTTTLRVQLSDNLGLSEVSFYLDDLNASHLLAWVPASGTSATKQWNWTPSNVSPGQHTLIAKVEDLSNNSAQANRSIVVQANDDSNQDQDQNQGQDENQTIDFSSSFSFETNLLPRQLPLLSQLESLIDFSTQRLGLESDIHLTRKLDVFRIVENGTTHYKNRFTVEVKNLLPVRIGRIGIIEKIPKEWVSDSNQLWFDGNYQIIESDPIVQVFLDNIDSNQTAVFSYYFETDSNQNPVTQSSFQQMIPPLGIITLEAGDACLSIACNDSNPCTLDYCSAGTCQTASKTNGTTCGENMACQEGNCISTIPVQPPIDWSFLMMGGGIIAGLIVALLIV